MALTDCPECHYEVSSAAVACTRCGFPLAEGVPEEPAQPKHKSAWISKTVIAICSFLFGAVIAPFVGNYVPLLAKPLSLVGVEPLRVSIEWVDPCTGLGLAEKQIVAGSQGSPDENFDYSAGEGIFQQNALTLKMRTKAVDVVIVEGWKVTSTSVSNRPAWTMERKVDGCGGESVATTDLELELDKGVQVLGSVSNFGKRQSPSFTVVKDKPHNVNFMISSCDATRRVDVTINYTVNGMDYSHDLPPLMIYADDSGDAYTSGPGGLVAETFEPPCEDGVASTEATSFSQG